MCQTLACANPLRVTLVLSDNTPAYKELGSEIRSVLPKEYDLKVIGVDEGMADAELYIAMGMKAAETLAHSAKPTLNILIPRAGFEKLKRIPSSSYSAIFMDQPMRRHLALIASILPNATSVGVLYDTPPSELESLRKQAGVMHFDLQEQKVDQEHLLAGALSDLLQVSDVILVLPDNNIYRSDTIRNILLETYRAHVPMVGLSANYVRAGALCAIYSTPQQIAYQAAEAIEIFANTGRLPISQYTREFEISVNNQVARSLGVQVKDADQLRVEVGRRQ
ncbi:MAG: ABC transporter substrate binding protein [Sideroxydans sp.]|nr:ABC transporter substrate binding protein [Sideroxydans sp.]